MIAHVFNSSVVAGPEKLVLPNLATQSEGVQSNFLIILLVEKRLLAASQEVIEYVKSLGLKFEIVEVAARVDIKAIIKLRQILKNREIKIIHAHDVKASTYSLLSSLFWRHAAKLVSTHHGVRGRQGFKTKFYENFYVRVILPFFDKVLAVCSSDQQILIQRGLKASKVCLHANGINCQHIARDSAEWNQARKEVRDSWRLGSDSKIVVAYVGRLAAEKGVERVIKVFSELVKLNNHANYQLRIYGQGPQQQNLEILSKKLGIESQVNFLGYTSQVFRQMLGLDSLILLSAAEGLPIVLLEAAWAGCPIVSTAVDGVNDLLPTDEFGLKIDVEETDLEIAKKLEGFLSQSDKAARCASALQERVRQEFSARVWIEKLSEIYQEVSNLSSDSDAAIM